MSRGISRVTQRGTRALVKFGERFAHGAKFTLGVHEAQGKRNHGETTIAEIAFIHEYGLGNAPQRSFLNAWAAENQDMIKADFEAATKAVMRGRMSFEKAGHILGSKYVGLIQKRMVEGIPPPNAPSTIKAKGSSTPLIDTGVLKASITYALRKAGEKK